MPELETELERHRAALTGHCYRMLGSIVDADDAVQETMVRAWRALERFDGRSSLKTWLYRIATNVCLDSLSERDRRERPLEAGPEGTVHDELVARPRTHWLEPIPDAKALPAETDPAERVILRQSIRLAFVAALQTLTPKQRAALVLTDVLGWSAAEVASSLETSVASVNSALQRARATLDGRALEPSSAAGGLGGEERALVDRFVDAFERYDMDALASILTTETTMNMPPYTLWLRGPQAITAWMLGRGAGCRGSVLLPTAANGAPAFGQYKADGSPWALVVLELGRGSLAGLTFFLDTDAFFPAFGLPSRRP
jgi:RNA polymerase sigma-70 factor (ECF subfamily)